MGIQQKLLKAYSMDNTTDNTKYQIDATQINGNGNKPNVLYRDTTLRHLFGYYFHFALQFYFTLNTVPLLIILITPLLLLNSNTHKLFLKTPDFDDLRFH